MNDEYIDRLIHGHLDNHLQDCEYEELESLLLSSESNRMRFWKLAEVHCLAQQAVNIAWPIANQADENRPHPLPAVSQKKSLYSSRLMALASSNRPATMLVVGMMIGMLTTGVAWGIATAPQTWQTYQLIDESFELGIAPGVDGIPSETGRWSGDFSEIVEAEQGVTPDSGHKMLKVLRADYEGKPIPEGSYFADLYHLVDLRPYRQALSSGNTFAQFSAKCNSIQFPGDERFYSSTSVFALTAEMVAGTSKLIGPTLENNALAGTGKACPRIDRDPRTWQSMECELRIPPETEFLMLRISVCHDDWHRRMTFEGQYLDSVNLTLTQRP